ncbi:ROK family transcriptional regulator [Streptomyces gibsoniae]|uniref:ROK family protein n=1 Tax=Streptomyces gibsoniae TaxID=3075529 RepID=A0ABU2U227_9ACTN|nr:ROK family protein [Streptomyces sp. DSM 41699]MDT0467229.1 ROK family protein [Streptomyces sp. DSM 41699]
MSVRYGLLTLLRDHGPQSCAQLAGRLQVPRPRLLAELDRLVASGTVVEAGPNASRGRRRSPLVELNPGLRLAAIDLDARSVGVEVTDGRLRAVASHSEHCDIRTGPANVLGRVTQILDKIRAEGHFTRLDAIGIGLPGPVSFREGIPVSPPIMPGWDRHPVRDVLSEEHGCPVAVDNDVNVMTLGEQHSGVARTVDNLIFVKIGSGIGCGVQIDGRIYRGAAGCAGDIGHIQVDADGPVCSCGNVGCLEALFSREALTHHAAEYAVDGNRSPMLAELLAAKGCLTARDVADGAAAGDAVCIGLVRTGGRRVGQVLAGLVSFMNPSMIVIGGDLADLGHILLAELRSVVYQRSLPLATGDLPIVLSELGGRAGVVGAAVLASELAYGDTV